MRLPLLRSACLLSLLIASSGSAVTMDWTPVGDPGNACETQGLNCFGAVSYAYNIGTYEVTNAQYVEFLNAKAATDPLELYNPFNPGNSGGITRSGSDGSYTYGAIAGRESMPMNWVSFYDALRFANWMNNGQGNGDTETGAYTLLGGTATPSNGASVTRNAGATIFLTSENEWYKAAYYDAISARYFDYPAGSNTQTTCAFPPLSNPNTANCYDGNDFGIANVGSYTGSPSPYGTFDQGGNVTEWNEALSGPVRVLRAGYWDGPPDALAASMRDSLVPFGETYYAGFRLAMIPEPGTVLLVVAGMLGLAGWRRARE